MIKVVAALIEKNDKILIARRSTGDPNVLGKWEFPGGKVEKDEDGVWLHLVGYKYDMFDINCFRKLSLSDVKSLLSKSYELVSCET